MKPPFVNSLFESPKLTASEISHTASSTAYSYGGDGTSCDADSEVSSAKTAVDEDSDLPGGECDPFRFHAAGQRVNTSEASSPDARSFAPVFVDDEEGYESGNEYEQAGRSGTTERSFEEGREGLVGGRGRKRLSLGGAMRRAISIGTRSPQKKVDKPANQHGPRKRFGFLSSNVEKPWDHKVFIMPNRRVSSFGAALAPIKRRFQGTPDPQKRERSKSLERACPVTPTPTFASRMTIESLHSTYFRARRGMLASPSTPAQLFGVLQVPGTVTPSAYALAKGRFPGPPPAFGHGPTDAPQAEWKYFSFEGFVTRRRLAAGMVSSFFVGFLGCFCLLAVIAAYFQTGRSFGDAFGDAWVDVLTSRQFTVNEQSVANVMSDTGAGEVQIVGSTGKDLRVWRDERICLKDGPYEL
ncbi:hypothetical protein CONPUDRAFT_147530 [Coniophora puteana RWD-64-598 SS2]|uniref:Transmembrane protein n=1 Tax=Coniophora puteana (strain RWD-64-598) TaxID=741705 RepID=A0A5M3M7E9_CONPW|nr:uncharacterized protein CONPUDRAFT_147530 [Coniophora puteana RWD-64-598 SS2]EIW74987.1 hypothetical protein CONPUDRAFT_147530 [Coniophora puteana RWD-64-598 SS2]